MNGVVVGGVGAVSPAGWGVPAMQRALEDGEALPVAELARPGWDKPLRVRRVPAPPPGATALTHPRLRRASPISRYAIAAALEALGCATSPLPPEQRDVGLVFCVMSGCVNYSRRFFGEVLQDPSTASPMLFPETVFNAPSSHLAAWLGLGGLNYTLVGDPGTFVQGLALAAAWLREGRVNGCVVVGAEEADWVTSDAFHLFSRRVILSGGAGALWLQRANPASAGVSLEAVTNSHLFVPPRPGPDSGHTRETRPRAQAAMRVRNELPRGDSTMLLCDGTQEAGRYDEAEVRAWKDWPGARLSPKRILGEGLPAAAAWQCVAVVEALQRGRALAANVSVVGCNQQAIGAHFRIGPVS